MFRIAMLVLLAFGTPAAAQSLSKGEVVFTGTNWRVMRTKDGMTDKVTCTGIWRDEYRVQLNAEAFYINRKGQGGVDAYHVRIDDAPAKEMVLATRTERDISAIMLKNIAELVRAKRLRVSGISILQSAIELYLDIADIAEAHAAIRGPKCK